MPIENKYLQQALLSNNLFENVSNDELKLLEDSQFSKFIFESGQLIIEEGSPSREIFLIVSGLVKVVQNSSEGESIELIRRGANDFIGEMGVIENSTRSTSIISVKKVETIIIDKDNFFLITGLIPQVMINVSKTIARRLRESDHRNNDELLQYQNLLELNRDLIIQKKELEKVNNELVLKNEELYTLATVDTLTEIYNRKYIMDLFKKELDKSYRYSYDLSLILIDIDYFKKLNDKYGHQAGDLILKDFGKLIEGSIRKTDALGRYGGEEFILVLPHTNKDDAEAIANKVRKAISDYKFTLDNEVINVTASFGVSDNSQINISLDKMISRADKALYKAKMKGRNQVVVYNEFI
ncbi:MAG: GGDEF domain-containing protein [Leptospiraceae bacterium]|nr:GGDEF domain-containing protein [Leptospiraceae bacterium]